MSKKLKSMCFISISILSNHLVAKIGLITSGDIQEIYKTHIKSHDTEEYKLRYVPLPLEKNILPWKWEGKDSPRVIALLEFERFVKESRFESQKGLALNGLDPEWYYLTTKEVVRVDYEEKTEKYDLHTLSLTEKGFDFVIVNQTLEHVYNPILCLKNISDHMAQGGILYLNVPVNSIPHSTPFHHYTGITPVGLGLIAKAAGFEILSIGQWENLEYLVKMHTSKGWPDYRELSNPGFNDIDRPVIAWIFARKI